ncbi:MAG: hypothetical protein HY966_04740 [Ignavibacteriales bacterium]|nr:hypothetical protein [Ignavibacteriales bacterium]
MTQAQEYIATLLDRISVWDLSVENKETLEKIKERLQGTDNLRRELERLFKVNGLGDFALQLMWAGERAEKNPAPVEVNQEEEFRILASFKRGVGGSSDAAEINNRMEMNTAEQTDSGFGLPPQEPTVDSFAGDLPVPSAEETASVISPNGGTAERSDREQEFSVVLEKFLESVQGGADDRMTLLGSLQSLCGSVATEAHPDDFKQFCTLLNDFLDYIVTNQYLDDIRVMNLTTNIQDGFAQWVHANADERAGVLDHTIETLRDFRTMFE